MFDKYPIERVVSMPQGPAPANPGRGVPPSGSQPELDRWEPVITRPDPMSSEEWQALLAASLDETEPPEDSEGHLDPESSILPPDEDLAAIEAETDLFAAEYRADMQYLAREETSELAGRVAAELARKRGPSRYCQSSRSRTATAKGGRRPAYFARTPAATTGSGSGHGTARIDTTHPILRPEEGERDRTGTLAPNPAKITDQAPRVAN